MCQNNKGTGMLTKQEIKNCMAGMYTPRVPAYLFWFDQEFERQNDVEIQKLRQIYENDFLFSYPVLKKRRKDPPLSEHEFTDEWGCLFAYAPGGVGAHPTRPIINSTEDWEKYIQKDAPLLNPDSFVAEARKTVQDHPERYVVMNIWRTFYERMYMLVGMERLWIDIALEEPLFVRMLEYLKNFTVTCVNLASEAGVDAVFLADDWGTQDRLQISPAMWRKYFKPAYAEIIRTAHERGVAVWMHSCGNIESIIPDWIEIGLDVLGQLQASALNLTRIASLYRGKITFFGGVDVQYNLIHGNADSIENEIKRLYSEFQAEKGKYMICPSNTIMPETPIESVRTLFDAIRKYGIQG